MLWRLEGDWLYFHVPGIWIDFCSWHAWYVPGTFRHIYILYQNPPYVMATGWRLIIFLGMRNMSLGYVDTFTFCIKTPPMSWSLDGDLWYFPVPGIWITSCPWKAWYIPGTCIDTFTFCIKFLCRSWSLDGDWLYFHVPGILISSWSWHAWYVPGFWDMSTHVHSVSKSMHVMAPGWRLVIFPCPRDMN